MRIIDIIEDNIIVYTFKTTLHIIWPKVKPVLEPFFLLISTVYVLYFIGFLQWLDKVRILKLGKETKDLIMLFLIVLAAAIFLENKKKSTNEQVSKPA